MNTLEKVKALIANQLNIAEDEIFETSNLIEDLNADSLDIVEMLMTLEEEFGINIEDDETENMKSVGAIVKLIDLRKK